MSQPGRVLLVIPCYNEASNVGALLDEVLALDASYDTLVVDDGSSDATHAAVAGRSRCLRLAVNLGIGGAVQAGIRFALTHGYELCVQVDGDRQHPPSEIEALIHGYRRSPASLVIGSRFLGDGAFRSSAARRGGIWLIRMALRLLFRRNLSDPTSGFRLMDRDAMQLFETDYPQDFPEPISAALVLARGLDVAEVPVQMRARGAGSTSIRGLQTLTYVVRVIGYLVLIRLDHAARALPPAARSANDR